MSFQPDQPIFTCTAVNLRAMPGYQGEAPPAVLALLGERTACIVTGAATLADGLTWWPVRVALADGRTLEGWAAERVGDAILLTDEAPLSPVQPEPVAPAPPIAPQAARTNRLGFYLHTTNNDAGLWDAIGRVQPPVMLIHEDAANDMLLREIRDFRAPDAFIIGRFYVTNDAQRAMLESDDPAGEGGRFAERILTHDFSKFTRRSSNGRLFIDAWMSLNECLPGPASSSYRENPAAYHRLYDAYDRFQVAFRARLVQEGVEAVAFNFAAGNFSEEAHYLDFFPRTLAAYTYLGFHEYGWPSLMPGQGAHTGAGLYRSVLHAARRGDGTRHRIIITEAGLTRAYGQPRNPDEGWLNRDETLDENRYWESLAWYNALLDQDDVLGACLYQVGHRGDWATFRHLGADNEGRTLHLVDRLAALRDSAVLRVALPAAAVALQPAPVGPATLSGKVTRAGQPAPDAIVRLVGDLNLLGNVRGAVIDAPGAVAWSRAVTGFTGALRTAWDRFVTSEVAGLTWDDFKRQALIANPLLAASDGHFVAHQTYFLPENAAATPAFLWDRRVSGYHGTTYQAWRDLVMGKVLSMNYAAFRRQLVAYHPTVTQTHGRLLADQQYLLPRTVGIDRYVLTATTSPRGRFRFVNVPAGAYTIEVDAPHAQHFTTSLTIEGKRDIELAVAPLLMPMSAPEMPGAAGSAEADAFIGTAGHEFVVNGRVLRFIGVNVRGLVWYGSGRTLPVTQPGHRQEVLDRAREMGARVVRVFLPCAHASTQEAIDRLREAVEIAGARDLYLLPAFVDFYSTTDFRIPGDDNFYEKLDPNFNINLLNGAFYRDGYRSRYLSFVRAVVAAFQDDTRIFAWEVGNELKYEPAFQDPGRAAFISFMHTVARTIKAIDANHLVTTGMISAHHASMDEGDLWRQLYGGPEFDFLTIHCYNEEYAGKQDHDYARVLEKPFLIEEAGFGHAKPGDRVELTRRDMDRWFGFGACGYLPWGFMPTTFDIGDGDDDAGMDRVFHGGDYDGLFSLYRERAAVLAAQADSITPVRPVDPPPPPPLLDRLPDFQAGETVFALTALRVSRTPGFVGKEESDTLTALSPGQAVTITGPREERDGLRWWLVRLAPAEGVAVEGWAAQATAEAVLLSTVVPAALPGSATVALMG
ncbi:MAG TPA: carboxypeptidase-like regulatory domain-containing protein [Caldilinea sp.]|nr:carboxypeptidase-like regulatory domain-containing protein [Caldilinea sp.]